MICKPLLEVRAHKEQSKDNQMSKGLVEQFSVGDSEIPYKTSARGPKHKSQKINADFDTVIKKISYFYNTFTWLRSLNVVKSTKRDEKVNAQ